MRVVVATDRYPALTSAQAGAAMATAWAELRAQVAVVPMGNALDGFQQALADLLVAGVDAYSDGSTIVEADTDDGLLVAVRPEHQPAGDGIDQNASSRPLGELLRCAVDEARARGPVARIVLELSDIAAHDGGAGLLSALGVRADRPLDQGVVGLTGITSCDLSPAREWLAGARIDLVVPAGEQTKHLVGLKGITSVRGHAVGLDPALLLQTDQALVDLARASGSHDQARSEGAGAAGGIGHAVLALGGGVWTGAGLCRELAGLDRTIGHADLVVTGGGQLDFGAMGGDVLFTVVDAATQALRPVVVVAGQNFVSSRELRAIGVEAAYSVLDQPGLSQLPGAHAIDRDHLTEASRIIARSWAW